MNYEDIFRYIGMILCVTASVYLYISGNKKIGSLVLLSFVLQFQSALYMQFIGYPENTGECWAIVKDHYACLPWSWKLSIHAAQLSLYITALAIFMLAKENRK